MLARWAQGIGDISGCRRHDDAWSIIELHSRLAEISGLAGAECAAVEVSSHALAQNRVDGVAFDTVLFTNLSRDHLDYHGDMQSYAQAKARLILECGAKNRIVNLDSEFGMQLAGQCGQDVITVSTTLRSRCERQAVRIRTLGCRAKTLRLTGKRRVVPGVTASSRCHYPVISNVANAVIVLALALAAGRADGARPATVLATVSAPPGRMQRVDTADGDSPSVYVDLCTLRRQQ